MTSYTNVFGGGVIAPSQSAYNVYTITTSAVTALVWPLETAPNSNLASQLMDIAAASTNNGGLQLPPANQVGLGSFLIINNRSSFNQPIYDASGAIIIAALLPGAIYFLYTTNNSTPAGVWNTFQYGAQASAPNVSALAGPGLLALGAVLAQDIAVDSLNTSFTISSGTRARMINWNGGAGTITLLAAGSAGASYYFQVRNSGSSIVNVTAAGADLINGTTTVSFNPGDSAFVVTDGSAWYTLGLGPTVLPNFGFTSINVPAVIDGHSQVVLAGVQLNQVAYKFTGALVNNTVVVLPAIKQQYWVNNATTGAFTLTFIVGGVPVSGVYPALGTTVAVAQGVNVILYTDGTNVINAVSGTGLGNPVLISQGGTSATSAPQALTNLGGTGVGTAVFTAANAAAAQAAIASPSTADACALAMSW